MFNFADPTPQREKFLGAIFLGHDVIFPGLMKFYFPDSTPQRENFLGAIFLGPDGVFPGWMKFYFLESRPPTREFLGEYSMVRTEYFLENFPWLRRSIPW